MIAEKLTGIYLIVSFNWPEKLTREMADNAAKLHASLADGSWIKETLAASGGIGAGPSSIWVFWLEDYAALDRLLKDKDDPISQAYFNFFSQMVDVSDSIREEVLFR